MSLRPTAFALAAALTLGAPAAMAAPQTDRSAEVTSKPVAAPHAERATYAQREQKDASHVGNYQGGSTVVIGISGGALIVILLVILILL